MGDRSPTRPAKKCYNQAVRCRWNRLYLCHAQILGSLSLAFIIDQRIVNPLFYTESVVRCLIHNMAVSL